MGISREIVDGTLVLEDKSKGESVEIHETVSNGVISISPKGDLSASIAHDMEDELTSIALVCKKIVLDMKEVSSIANSVIRMLLDVQHIVDNVDGELIIKGLSPAVMSRFEEMGLDAVFYIEDAGM